MRKRLFHFVVALSILGMFSSCEAFIHAQGAILDRGTLQPVPGVMVQLLWRHNWDTMSNSGIIADTLNWDERKKVRKQGAKDNYKSFDFGSSRWSQRVPLVTDMSGKFSTGTYWVSAALGVPKVSVLFTKEGYKTLLVNDRERHSRSVFYLEKLN
jgi:hypothetical protein